MYSQGFPPPPVYTQRPIRMNQVNNNSNNPQQRMQFQQMQQQSAGIYSKSAKKSKKGSRLFLTFPKPPNTFSGSLHQMRERMLQQQQKERLLQQQQKQSLVVPVNATAGADQLCTY